jgi:hypothetical protein
MSNPTEYVTVADASSLTGKCGSMIRKDAVAGRIVGAVRINPRFWLIPRSALAQLKVRHKAGRKKK